MDRSNQLARRQRSLEAEIRQAGERLGLTARVTKVAGDGHFIDFDFSGPAPDAANVVRQMLIGVFESDGGTGLRFSWTEIQPPAS